VHFLTHFRDEVPQSFPRFRYALFSGIIDAEASFEDGFCEALLAGPNAFGMLPFRPVSLLLYLFRPGSARHKARISVKTCQHSERPVEDRLVPTVHIRGRVLGTQGGYGRRKKGFAITGSIRGSDLGRIVTTRGRYGYWYWLPGSSDEKSRNLFTDFTKSPCAVNTDALA